MPAKIEQILNSSMSCHKSLSLPDRLESSHPSLPHPGRLMRLLSPIILILLSTVDRLRNQLPMSHAIAAQLVRHDLPGLATMAP